MAFRKAVYILLLSAIVINAGVAFWNGGFQYEVGKVVNIDPDTLTVSHSIEVPLPGDGDTCTYDHSLGINLVRTTDDGDETGLYLLDGEQVRNWGLDSVDRDLRGMHIMSYISSGGQDLTYEGDIDQRASLERDLDGIFTRQVRGTSLTFDPSILGPSMDSDIEVTGLIYTEPWEDMIWTCLLDGNRTFSEGDQGQFPLNMIVEEADLNIEDASVQWSVTRFVDSPIESWVSIEADVVTERNIDITYSIRFSDGVPWPTSVELDLSGTYDSEEGPIQIQMALSKKEVGRLIGDGVPVDLLPIRPTPVQGTDLDIRSVDVVPMEGDESSFAFSPEEAMVHTRSRSGDLQNYLDTYPDATMYQGEYFRNETNLGVTLMVWNITLSAEGGDGKHHGYFFEVGMSDRGTVGEKKNLVLLHEGETICLFCSSDDRSSLTLSAHERVLSESEMLSGLFMNEDGYVDSYSLNMISRGGETATPFTAMARNTLGMKGSGSRDIFVSRAQDSDDSRTGYISVVEGRTGQLITRTVETGGYMNLLETMELI